MDSSQYTKTVLLFVSIGMRVLSARVVLILTLLLTFSLFAWSLAAPSWERIAASTIFAVLVFLPATRIDYGVKKERDVISPKEPENG